MSVENPKGKYYWISHWRYSAYRGIGPLKSGENFDDLFSQNPSQAESQKVHQIEDVLNIIDKMGPIKTTDIITETGLSTGSVNRTLKLLREKNIVTYFQTNDKQNNAKFYTLKINRAIIYHRILVNWKTRKIEKIFRNLRIADRKYDKIIEKIIPYNWYDIELNLTPKQRKQFNTTKTKIAVGEIQFPEANEIIQKYVGGFYCIPCFDKGKLSELRRTSDETDYCKICGVEITPNESDWIDKRKMKELMREQKFKSEKRIRKIVENNVKQNHAFLDNRF